MAASQFCMRGLSFCNRLLGHPVDAASIRTSSLFVPFLILTESAKQFRTKNEHGRQLIPAAQSCCESVPVTQAAPPPIPPSAGQTRISPPEPGSRVARLSSRRVGLWPFSSPGRDGDALFAVPATPIRRPHRKRAGKGSLVAGLRARIEALERHSTSPACMRLPLTFAFTNRFRAVDARRARDRRPPRRRP